VATAVALGATDFFAGLASRRSDPVVVATLANLGAFLLLAAAIVGFGQTPAGMQVGWALAAGVCGGVGYVRYCRALAAGAMGPIATLTALTTAMVPLVVGLALGERFGPVVVVAVVAMLASVTLLAYTPGAPVPGAAPRRAIIPLVPAPPPSTGTSAPPPSRQALVDASVAGVSYGAFFLFIARAGPGDALWPVLVATGATSVVIAGAWIAVSNRPDWSSLRSSRRTSATIAATAVCQAVATVVILLAVRQGLVSLVAVVAALSPAPTMLLARAFLGERLRRAQLVGVTLALSGIVVLAAA